MCKIFRQSRSRGPELKVGWLIFDLFVFTCSLEGDLEEASILFGGWTEKSIRGLGATIEGMCGSSRKRSKTEEVDREARK